MTTQSVNVPPVSTPIRYSVDIDFQIPQDRLVLERNLGLEADQTPRAIELAEDKAATNPIRIHAKTSLMNGSLFHERELFEVPTGVAQDVSAFTNEGWSFRPILDVQKLGDVSNAHQVGSELAWAAMCSRPVPSSGPTSLACE